MYNGIGLQTARGSGTNGYVQKNMAFLRNIRNKVDYKSEEEMAKLDQLMHKKPNEAILNHERKRQVELKCIEMQELMQEQGYLPEEIEQKVSAFRKMLMDKEGVTDSPHPDLELDERGKPITKDSHTYAAANEAKNAKLKEAFGLGQHYVDGSSLDPLRKEKEKAAAAAAAAKQYSFVKSSSEERSPSPPPKKKKKKHRQSSKHKEDWKSAKRSESPPISKNKKAKRKNSSPSSDRGDSADRTTSSSRRRSRGESDVQRKKVVSEVESRAANTSHSTSHSASHVNGKSAKGKSVTRRDENCNEKKVKRDSNTRRDRSSQSPGRRLLVHRRSRSRSRSSRDSPSPTPSPPRRSRGGKRRRSYSRSRSRSRSSLSTSSSRSRSRSRYSRSRSRSYSRSSSRSRSRSRSRSKSQSSMRKKSPSFREKRRITSARKRPVPYERSPATPDTDRSSCSSFYSSYSDRSHGASRSRSRSRSRRRHSRRRSRS